MSSWSGGGSGGCKRPPPILVVKHNSGFFSCCSFLLQKIIEYFNAYSRLPEAVDTSNQFLWYRPQNYTGNESIIKYFFTEGSQGIRRTPYPILFYHFDQFKDYTALPLVHLKPFIQKYFTVSEGVNTLVKGMESTYLINPKTTCVLFYRGNDKATETALPEYGDYLARARALLEENPSMRFLLQSDETEFIEAMSVLPNSFYMKDEIRHIRRATTSVDLLGRTDTFEFSLRFLAITVIMSQCRWVICNSGNCSLWIVLFRGNVNGVQQFLNGVWFSTP